MRLGTLVALVALVGCSFKASSGQPAADAATGSDAIGSDAGGDAMGIDAAVPAVLVDPTDADLIACYRFEGGALDGSMYGNDGAVAAASFAAGVDGMAIVGAAGSDIDLGEDASLEITNMTLEMWLQFDALPDDGERMGIVDRQGDYSLFLHPDGLERGSRGRELPLTVRSLTRGRAGGRAG